MIEVDVEFHRPGFESAITFRSDAPSFGVFGPSGAGKSTLLSLIAGLVRPDRGLIRIMIERCSIPPRGSMFRPIVGMWARCSRIFGSFRISPSGETFATGWGRCSRVGVTWSICWKSGGWLIEESTSFPEVSGNGWPSVVRCFGVRRSCFWMNRWRHSTIGFEVTSSGILSECSRRRRRRCRCCTSVISWRNFFD